MSNYISGYALALYQIAKDKKTLKKYKIISDKLLFIINKNPRIINLLDSYDISQSLKQQIIKQSFSKILTKEWNNLFAILSKKRKFHLVLTIIKKLLKFINDDLKIKSGIVYSTILLTSNEIKSISKKTSLLINSAVELINKLDNNLISGLKVVINDKEFDYSLKSRLDFLHSKLLVKSEEIND